ncbi:MAG TPA: urease accessory UreF family protein [Polyangia bacterium]|jgi:urease accessory protein|nr:urease accessory UreF family protein [Polyangia bacterium]
MSDPVASLRLLQLVSPALPIGTFAYSQALEAAVAAGWIDGEPGARDWIGGLLAGTVGGLDLPVLLRLHGAWTRDDQDAVAAWSRFLLAARAAGELQTEERQLGGNLARLLGGLGVGEAPAWIARADVSYAAMFALAAVRWQIPLASALQGHAFAWVEAQTSAAVRLVPLGQTAGQRILLELGALIPAVVARALAVADDDIAAAAPSHAIASARHETQYSRLFRS